MNFRFRKPFSHPKEEGIDPNAIVVYRSRPYTYGDDFDQIKKGLWIDLWLFVVRFEWVKKVPPTRSQKIYGNLT